ncbi:uncharacterized protein LOC144477749, partial [Augochlora pura]
CLQYFSSQERLDIHSIDCSQMNECALILPTEDDKWLKFKNHAYSELAPFVIYADLECVLEKQQDQGRGACQRYQHHRAFSVAYYLHCQYDSTLCEYQTYRDEKDCIAWFATKLYELSCKLQPIFDRTISMTPMTATQISNFHTATHCHMCEKPFDDCDVRVRHHCHFTGAYRGPTHNGCNLSCQSTYVIPVVFHNLSGYDAYFIIKELANAFEGKIDVLPITKEKYISFTKHTNRQRNNGPKNSQRKHIKFRFIDSFKFLNSSLDKLSSYLDQSDLHIMRSQFDNLSNDDFHLLTRKGVFPYDYVATYDKLSDTHLPPREAFYNELQNREISDSDYHHASVTGPYRVLN